MGWARPEASVWTAGSSTRGSTRKSAKDQSGNTESLARDSERINRVAFFLFLFVGAAVYHRYIYHELPMSRICRDVFHRIAPTAILSVILFKMIHLFEHHAWFGLSAETFVTIAKFGIFVTRGFAAWWFVLALIIIIYYLRVIELPYALSWWAFTFASGALCVSSGVAWKISSFSSVQYFYYAAVLFLLLVWSIVLLRTANGVQDFRTDALVRRYSSKILNALILKR